MLLLKPCCVKFNCFPTAMCHYIIRTCITVFVLFSLLTLFGTDVVGGLEDTSMMGFLRLCKRLIFFVVKEVPVHGGGSHVCVDSILPSWDKVCLKLRKEIFSLDFIKSKGWQFT